VIHESVQILYGCSRLRGLDYLRDQLKLLAIDIWLVFFADLISLGTNAMFIFFRNLLRFEWISMIVIIFVNFSPDVMLLHSEM